MPEMISNSVLRRPAQDFSANSVSGGDYHESHPCCDLKSERDADHRSFGATLVLRFLTIPTRLRRYRRRAMAPQSPFMSAHPS